MTCIVGMANGTEVVIGADSASTSGWALTVRRDPKVFLVPHTSGAAIIGFTSSYRMGQLLQYSLQWPQTWPDLDGDVFEWMVLSFVPAVRTALRDGGWLKKDNEREEAGAFLVGLRGRIFEVDSDLQVAEALAGYIAVGCGSEIALGAMHASTALAPLFGDPRETVRRALRAAEALNAGVRGPFLVERVVR